MSRHEDVALSHQEGLNAANQLAGAGFDVYLRLSQGEDHRQDRFSKPYATVSVSKKNTHEDSLDGLIELRDRVRAVGWDCEHDGVGSLDVTGKWKAPAQPRAAA